MCELIMNGGRRLNGEICVQGSKNAVLPVLAATILTDEECIIHNCPHLADTKAALEILTSLGCSAGLENGTAKICAKGADNTMVPKSLMQKMRSSVSFMGAILARGGEAVLYRPGGCCLGERPIDIHVSSLMRLGAEVYECGDCICSRLKEVKSGDITLLYPSVGVTENIMLMCAGKNCEVRIFNPAREPEIVELQNFLNMMGADIRGAGSDLIRICSASGLHGCEYKIMQDRIAAATYACMTAGCGGELLLRDGTYEHMRMVAAVLSEAGCLVLQTDDGVLIKSDGVLSGVHKIKTLPYPGFPTDAQPILSAAFAASGGVLKISETIFENRFSYVPELIKMGADITQNESSIELRGVSTLSGSAVAAKDLRGGAALVAAGLVARGTTIVSGVEYIDRGYEQIEEVLRRLGADIRRI